MLTGQLDVRLLTAVPSQPYLRLTAEAAASWEALADEVQRRHGWRPTLTDAYRDYAAQVRLFRERYTSTPIAGRPTKVWGGIVYYLRPGMATAAVPGTSNHGRADTVDVRDMASFKTERYRQFSEVATGHGWSNKEGAKIGEPWHWQKVGAGTATTNPPAATTVTAPTTREPVMLLIHHVNGADQAYYVTDGRGLALVPPSPTYPDLGVFLASLPVVEATGPDGLHPWIRAGQQLGTDAPDVDEAALAAALVPLLEAHMASLSQADVERIANAAGDVLAKRLAG